MSSYTKWVSFELACRLRCLQQGTLNVGNTLQNKTNLQTLCIANANAGGLYARWGIQRNGSAQPVSALQVYPAKVPGFVVPIHS